MSDKNWVVRFTKYVATWRDHRRVIKHLNRLSDRELQDIGIDRHDIDHLIWLKQDREIRGRKIYPK